MNARKLPPTLALVAGALDLGSGLGLMLFPSWTLGMMFIQPPGEDALDYVRFVGAFLAAVGGMYLCALIEPEKRLRTVLEVSILFRLASGSLCGWMVSTGRFDPAWLLVCIADCGLVGTQVILLQRRACWQ